AGDMDVVFKEGMVYLHAVKFGKKTWRKTWMALFKASSTGVGRLELSNVSDGYYPGDQKRSGRQKSTEKKVVRLSDCLSATPAVKESCPSGCTAFCLNTTQSSYTFASRTSEEWLSALCLLAFQVSIRSPSLSVIWENTKRKFAKKNTIWNFYYFSNSLACTSSVGFKVKIKSTTASKRCKLAGEYVMSSEAEALVMFSMDTGDIIFRWPYRLLRRFGKGGFSIEAGRRCESGEGLFIFLTRHGLCIFQAIAKQCSLEIPADVEPVSEHRRSLCDLTPEVCLQRPLRGGEEFLSVSPALILLHVTEMRGLPVAAEEELLSLLSCWPDGARKGPPGGLLRRPGARTPALFVHHAGQQLRQLRDVNLRHLQGVILGQLFLVFQRWNDAPQLVEGFVQAVHPPPLPRVCRHAPVSLRTQVAGFGCIIIGAALCDAQSWRGFVR
uniref:IRS-type PTB domain-containing protein n=1 Tax=Oryzias melastigma TaxID=30732 RepID=A0A3B3BQZ0_ORYME